MKRILHTLIAFLLICTPLLAGEKAGGVDNTKGMHDDADSTKIFYFVSGKKMFFADYKGNRKTLKAFSEVLRRNEQLIKQGKMVIRVNGYSNSNVNKQTNLQIAKNRSNQVKTYYILKHGLTTHNFRTRNTSSAWNGLRNIVTVSCCNVDQAQKDKNTPLVEANPLDVTDATKKIDSSLQADTTSAKQDVSGIPSAELPQVNEQSDTDSIVVTPFQPKVYTPSRWSLSTNLLYWGALAPNIGVHYRLTNHWRVGVEGLCAWWSNDKTYKYYRVAEVEPTIKYYLKDDISQRGHHFGIYAQGGLYELKDGRLGHIGEFIGAGVSYGYQLRLSPAWSIDFEAGFGAIATEYRRYEMSYGCYAYKDTRRHVFFGPSRASVSFIWNIPVSGKKGGVR